MPSSQGMYQDPENNVVVFSGLILCKASLASSQNAQQLEGGCQEHGESLIFKTRFDTAAKVQEFSNRKWILVRTLNRTPGTRCGVCIPTLSASPGHGAEPAAPLSGQRRR